MSRSREKSLNEIAVRALTMGLNLLELFDFYNESEFNSQVQYG